MPSRRTTTKDVGLLFQLFQQGQLLLAPEYQRNSVWPRPAKAYLIDTILQDKPIPPLTFQRVTSAQKGLNSYNVIDGQQRLRAVFEFLDNRLRLTQSKEEHRHNRRYRDLTQEDQARVTDYDFVVEELTGYTSADIEDIFVRVNRYVIALNAQELRKAKERGAFAEFVEAIGKWDWWKTNRIFTNTQVERMRPVEFAAELVILLGEGPQDKKASINIWYAKYRDTFPEARDMERRLQRYLDWLTKALPHIAETRFRKPVDLYSLIGALDAVSSQGETLAKLSAQAGGKALKDFDRKTKLTRPPVEVQRYILAASRQTDNLIPRQSRIDVIEELLKGV